MNKHKKYALVTGATNGIGIPTVLEVARRGMYITILCRNAAKGEQLKQRILSETGNTDVELLIADQNSIADVERAANEYLASDKPLHLLINNAGVVTTSLQLSQDGYEQMMAVNYLSVFVLTTRLLPRLIESGTKNEKARIVNVATEGYKLAKGIDYDNINAEKGFKTFPAYGHSKLAVMLFNQELAKRLKDEPVNTFVIHPGWVDTGLGKDGSFLMNVVAAFLARLFAKNPEQGAATTLFAAFDASTEDMNGGYFSDSKPKQRKAHALDMEEANKLWLWTEQKLGRL